MCGIAGFIDRSACDAKATLERMLRLIEHRGPDGQGVHTDSDIGLAIGMRRLSIIDLENGLQPIWNEDSTIGVVFNGEIYNYLELRHDLEKRGHRFRTESDTEVLVHLYEEKHDRMIDELRGMFSFCIFDSVRRSLLIARDHFGQKPIYYSSVDGKFAFASELKCLLALPWVRDKKRADAFLTYITCLSLPSPFTHFEDIKKIEPGQVIRVPVDQPDAFYQVADWRYSLNTAPDLTDIDSAIDTLEVALQDSVAVHLRADVPVGVLLSSGLDSRVVLAHASKIQSAIQTFTVGFGAYDSELVGAAKTASEVGSKHHTLELTSADFGSSIERVAHLLDEPVGDPACFALLRVCEMARGHVKVLLSGEGSDELFAGYDKRYSGMLATLRRSNVLRRLGLITPAGNFASQSRLLRFCARTKSSYPTEIALLRLEGLPGNITQPRGLTVSQVTKTAELCKIHGELVFRAQRDLLSELLCFDVRWQLAESLLQKADKMSMGAGIELRTPFLDLKVAAVAARIPSALKLAQGGPGKLVLRKMLSRHLKEGLDRPKQGFPVPLNNWFAGPLREQIEGELFASDSVICDHIDRGLLRIAWNDFLAGQWDGGRAIFSLWLYETWARGVRRSREALIN